MCVCVNVCEFVYTEKPRSQDADSDFVSMECVSEVGDNGILVHSRYKVVA